MNLLRGMLIIIILVMVFKVGTVSATEKEVPVFMQPFDLLFDSNDSHVMLYFKGHPEYEAVEAMIKEKENGNFFIRAMLTKHDDNNTQIDLINDKSFVEQVTEEGSYRREVHYTPIQYSKTEEDGKININLKFTTHKGEQVNFNFYAADEVSKKHAGLINPDGHSSDTVLPIMLCEKSTLASPKSKISFDGKQYKIPRKIWIPLLFTGMEGFYSENFEMLIFKTGNEEMKLANAPKRLVVGEKWIYKSKIRQKTYEIVSKKDKQLVINQGEKRITAHIGDNDLLIKRIQLSKDRNSKKKFTIEFSPYLAVNLQGKRLNEEVEFETSYNNEELIKGKVQLGRKNNLLVYKLVPENPDWAKKRVLSIEVINQRNCSYLLNREIEQ